MKKIQDLKSTYKKCESEGLIQFRKDIDKHLVKSLLQSALIEINSLKKFENLINEKNNDCFFLFKSKYDVLRKLLDAALLFDRLKCSNHQCSNAFLCVKHKEWDFDWKILEEMRLIRNRIYYEGKLISLETWNSYKLKFEIYINSLIKIVKEKLSKD